jgi:hypothetical protein
MRTRKTRGTMERTPNNQGVGEAPNAKKENEKSDRPDDGEKLTS